MERIQRMLMLLKPDSVSGLAASGTLKMLAVDDGVDLSLVTDLPSGDHALYLFLKNGTNRCVGNLADGRLAAGLAGIRLQDIRGAAAISQSDGRPSFLLRSAGMDWPRVIERFRIERQSFNTPPTAHALQKTQEACGLPAEAAAGPPQSEPSPQPDALPETPQSKPPPPPDFSVEPQPETPPFQNASAPPHGADGSCPHVKKQDNINPFPTIFPGSEWVKVSYPGPIGWWHYISGKIYKGGELIAKALGVPGEYGMAPPIWLEGFGTYMRCASGDTKGYWLMFQDAETGELLDMGRSPRDG